MKLLRMKTLGLFGIGFLAGSAAGRGPWEKTQAQLGQLKEKVSSRDAFCLNGKSADQPSTAPAPSEI